MQAIIVVKFQFVHIYYWFFKRSNYFIRWIITLIERISDIESVWIHQYNTLHGALVPLSVHTISINIIYAERNQSMLDITTVRFTSLRPYIFYENYVFRVDQYCTYSVFVCFIICKRMWLTFIISRNQWISLSSLHSSIYTTITTVKK